MTSAEARGHDHERRTKVGKCQFEQCISALGECFLGRQVDVQ